MNKQPTEGRIQFRSDPAKISAIQAYMAATIHDLKWDLCTTLFTQPWADMLYGDSDSRSWPII
jgi:hypothetical protein